MKEYIQSIDKRLGKIEQTVLKINGEVSGLRMRVYGITAILSTVIAGAITWLVS